MTGMDSKEVLDALTDEQRAPVLARGANILLQAAPGSGKTRVIIARCISLLDDGADPSKLLLLTFSRRAVGELRDRLKGALGVASALPDVRTFHGFASRLLSVEGPTFRNRRLLSEPANKTLFAEAVARTALRAFPSGVAQSQAFLREAGTRVDELRRAGDAAIAEIEAGASPRLQDLIAIHRSVQTLRDELRVADYNDLVGRALALAGDPSSSVHRWLNGRYEHLLVDEFQDTDPLQLALLQYVGGQIFAVGDSAQAIYGFRGAARDALERAESVLQMRSFSLGQSFRCPQAVCALASATPNLSRAMTLESRSDMPGNITVRRAATTLDEAALVANEVRQARDAGVEPGEIAVLLRASEPLAPLIAQELQRRGIPTAQLGGDALVNDDAVSVVLSALRVFANPSNAAAWANLLVHPALCFPPLTIRLAFDPARIDSVETGVAAIESARVDGRIQATTLIAALREAYQHWRNDEPVRAARTFARRANILGYVVRCGEDQARISGGRIRRFLDALYDLRDVRHRLGSSVRSADVFDDFLTQAAHWNEPSDPSRETNAVRILTIHAAKGLEFDSVVVAGAAESHFPQAWRYDSLLDEDDIAYARAHGMDLGLLPAEQIAEESSLWYVAVTRSKRSLVITYSASDADGSPLAPSRFIPLDVLEESKQANPYRADLTYRSVDPASVTLQPGEPVTLERRIPTTGVEKWLTCRRQFFYDVLLRLHDDEKPLNRALGIAIHRTLQAFHGKFADFKDVQEGAAVQWTARLIELREETWRECGDQFGSPLEASSAARRADRMLRNYAVDLEQRAQAQPFRVDRIEEYKEYEVGGIALSGKIDRVDYVYGTESLAVLDYKTGRTDGKAVENIGNLAEAAEDGKLWTKDAKRVNPQLSLYRKAIPGTRVVSYIYLGGQKNKDDVPIFTESLDASDDAATLQLLDDTLERVFFLPWREGAVTELPPAHDANSCRTCRFTQLCPGVLPWEET